jgi:predicted DNA-binding protein
MYCIQLPDEMMADLWKLKKYYGRGTIISQVKEAVYRYLQEEEEKLGRPINQFREDEKEDSR